MKTLILFSAFSLMALTSAHAQDQEVTAESASEDFTPNWASDLKQDAHVDAPSEYANTQWQAVEAPLMTIIAQMRSPSKKVNLLSFPKLNIIEDTPAQPTVNPTQTPQLTEKGREVMIETCKSRIELAKTQQPGIEEAARDCEKAGYQSDADKWKATLKETEADLARWQAALERFQSRTETAEDIELVNSGGGD
jgi:hypothetical protein